jgi:hypothetical protein
VGQWGSWQNGYDPSSANCELPTKPAAFAHASLTEFMVSTGP